MWILGLKGLNVIGPRLSQSLLDSHLFFDEIILDTLQG